MKYFLIFLFLTMTIQASINCAKHPILCQIIGSYPNINKGYALHLSNIIHKYSKNYKLDSRLFTAILRQESAFKLNAKNCLTGIQEKTHKKIKVCFDYGISQINYKTAEAHNFDLKRLTKDLDYSVKAGAIILSDMKRRYGKRELNWWTRYNSSSKTHREIYGKLVKRFF